MQCPNCSTPLPQGANACPACGSASPSFHAGAGSSPDGRTAAGSSQYLQSSGGVGVPPSPMGSEVPRASLAPQKPPTYYGSQPYYSNEPNPYEGSVSNPYGDSYASSPYRTEAPPPPPLIKKRKNTAAFVIILCVVLLALVGAGVFAFAIKPSNGSPRSYQATVTPGQATVTQPNQPTSPYGKQALYDQTVVTTPVMNDPLSGPDNYGLDNYTGQDGKTRCFFSQGRLHSLAQPGYFSPCYARATNYQNFVLQVKMTLISGHSAGLVFRADYTNDKGYQFRISTDGTYALNRIILDQQGNPIGEGQTVASGSSTFVQKATNQTNQLAVLAQGDTISLFINGKYVESAKEGTYHSGQVGIYVDSDAGVVEGVFSNLQVWKLA